MEKDDELKPVRCGCGGEANIHKDDGTFGQMPIYTVSCNTCGMRSGRRSTEVQAVTAWNRAMGIAEKSSTVEQTAKAIELDASVTDIDGYKYHRSEYLCGACKKKVICGDEYCSHCGARLEWDE